MKRMLVLNFGNTAKRRLLFGALIVLINLITSYSTFAQVSPCDSNIVTERVTYFPISGTLTTNATDPRVSPGDSDYRVRLRGSVHYKDPGSGTLKNRPVLIFLHGHEQTRPEACRIVKYFTLEQNWVVFTPLRRGYSLDVADNDDPSDDIRSTGIYIDDFVDACDRTQELATFSGHLPHLYCGANQCRPSIACGLQTRRSAVELEYLNQQRIDVREAITYIKSRGAIADGHVNPSWKLADAKRIVILGHSYGGALTVFTNKFDYGQSVAIDVQGGELSWGNDDEPFWSSDLQIAMLDQARPIYLFQPKNGRYINPTKILFGIAADQEYR